MGYLHIENLYKNQTILLFKECYALEKIHGTSAHISFKDPNFSFKNDIHFSSGGCKHKDFISLFDENKLKELFQNRFNTNVVIYGEVYGSKLLKMSETYGNELKFIVFDVLVGGIWHNVPEAEKVAKYFGLEFVDYSKVSTDLEALDAERDKPSTQAIRNGCGEKKREGVVLRPLIEMCLPGGGRIIAKHKRKEFLETATARDVSPEQLKVLLEAEAIADEWATAMRLEHVLDKVSDKKDYRIVIDAMIEDIYREAKGEIVESPQVAREIGKATAKLLKNRG